MEATGDWARGLGTLAVRLAPRSGRAEPGPRRRARAHLQGLLAPAGRTNGRPPAAAAAGRTPDGGQDPLGRMRRDADAGRDDRRADVVAHPGDPEAVLALDATGFGARGGAQSVGA